MDPITIAMIMNGIGAGLGGLGGKKAKTGSTYTKGQRANLEQLNDMISNLGPQNIQDNPNYQTGSQYLQDLYNDPAFFEKFEAPLQRQFEEETVPGLANRFASMGSGGSLGSTGFRNQLAREGSNLSTNIANLRGNMQMQGLPQLMSYAQQPFQNLMSMYNTALSPQPNNQYFPATPGPIGNVLGSFAGGMSGGAGQYAGQQLMNSWSAGQSPMTR